MEDYKVILQKSEQELAALKQREAVVNSKIESLVEELKLDKEKPLAPQIEELKSKLQKDIEASNNKVQELLNQLSSLNDE